MSIGERLCHEAREIGLVTLYFLACFAIFLSLKKLLLKQYDVTTYVFHAAVIGALVVAKVVVLLEKTSFGSRFQDGSLIAHDLRYASASPRRPRPQNPRVVTRVTATGHLSS